MQGITASGDNLACCHNDLGKLSVKIEARPALRGFDNLAPVLRAFAGLSTLSSVTTVHNFDTRNGDGAFPAGLVHHTNGIFDGPTIRGGKISYHFCPAWCGTLFSLSVP